MTTYPDHPQLERQALKRHMRIMVWRYGQALAERIECGEHERGEADVISWGRVGRK